MENKQYLVYFMAGSSGRFLSTILYGLLVDPVRIDYPYNSAHEFQIIHPESTQFHPTPAQSPTWHTFPTNFDPMINYIIVRVSADDLPEISHNNLYKNILWNITRWESGILLEEPPAYQTFLRVYKRAMGLYWRKRSISELTDRELKRMQQVLVDWDIKGAEFAQYSDPQVPAEQSHLIINFHDIFTSSTRDSWVALDQLIQYTQVSAVDPQVRDNYQRYVFQRNSDL